MGDLLRRYWHPVAVSSQLAERGAKPVRILGEDLVLFRDRSGNLGLIGDRCPHRRAGMVFGIPEENGLRCAYHGWLWAADGRCLEQPYEQTEDPQSTFRDRVTIKAYPVQEFAGLIWAYLGPAPVPLLPHWDLFVTDGVARDIGAAVVPCNWLQIMDNGLDPIHVEWLHQVFSDYVLERLGRPDLKRRAVRNGKVDDKPVKHERIGFTVFDRGIIKRRIMTGSTEEDDDWRIGHPIVFPTTLRLMNQFQIRVPIDDTHTWHLWYSIYPPSPGVEPRDPKVIPYYEVPVPRIGESAELPWSLLDNNSGQDMSIWYSQGPIPDRWNEHLGRSDQGVVAFRNLLLENLARIKRGEDPMNVFWDPEENERVELPVEGSSYRFGDMTAAQRRTGQAAKYSPILKEAVARTLGADALLEPVHSDSSLV
jgi:5,5'-dehydrodivanillate O-demethylase